MDRTYINVRAEKKYKIRFELITNNRFYGKIKARKQLVLTREEIRT